jgi:hypothetical protein
VQVEILRYRSDNSAFMSKQEKLKQAKENVTQLTEETELTLLELESRSLAIASDGASSFVAAMVRGSGLLC